MDLVFETSYRQLQPSEKAFVDGYISELETFAVRSGQRLDAVLSRCDASRLPERQRDFIARPIVRAAITERVKDIVDQAELSAHRVLKELSSIAFASLADYGEIDPYSGEMIWDFSKCTPEQLSAIKKIEYKEGAKGGKEFKVELHDKIAALDRFMRYMGLLDADNPYWAAEQARATNAKALPENANDNPAERYDKWING